VKRFFACLLIAAMLLPCCNADKRSSAPAPERPGKVITMRAGALRLMLYMSLADQVAYIERNDLTRVVPYMMAFPELKQRPVIGVGNNYDPEALAASDAELIISTYMSGEEAEALSQKTGKPVVGLAYGDLYHYKADFYKSLTELGRLFQHAERADSLITYIENTIAEVSERAGRSQHSGQSAYIGGIAFNGLQGITSTRAQYPPFIYLHIENPADALPTSLESIGMGQKNMLIDKEQIISWDTDFLFLDAAGQPAWEAEIEQPVLAGLRAIQSRQTYVVLPFNWHTINYENLLCNMWFVGKTVYPDVFADVDVEQKCREIFTVFYGRDIFDEVKATYRPYEKR
jgi:iron complex transport system substrate-binding protein